MHAHSAHRRAARPGAWQIEPGRALRLRPREDAILRAGHGMLWVTFDRVAEGAGNESGDHILEAGQRLHVAAGDTVVIGAFGPRDADASFDWEPPARATARPDWRDAAFAFLAGLGRPLVPAR